MNAQATWSVPNPKLAGYVIANASKKVKIRASENPDKRDRNKTMGSRTNISNGRSQILPASFSDTRGLFSSFGP